ncbi:uncharacterized protein HaLaN_11932 [Haematococcus lacustris]|uniref:SURP motif domain-containing protein n=1 Tax=Haematococcus lacustris TaxID=44745 RepID=A0A699ZA08_HAELA|nr:uncharacterized protein HaLaN_11932 [Haematococcus lacustris]
MADPNAGAIVVVEGAQPQTSTAIVPVGDVRTAGFDLNEIKKLATQTKAIGVIMPPPDIRAIVDKTASPEFEKRILANERSNVKFNFLQPTDPYHAYYQMRIKFFSSDGDTAKDTTGGVAAAAAELERATLAGPQVIPHALAKLEKPEDEMYTVGAHAAGAL